MRPHELRQMLEGEVREAVERLLAEGGAIDAAAVAGAVLERHQLRDEVQARLDFLWRYLEAYVGFLAAIR
jgi:hypothetical protein